MINLVKISFRNKKSNLIYLILLMVIIAFIIVFEFAKEYFNYSITNIYGIREENRGFVINTQNDITELIQRNFEIEKENIKEGLNYDGYYIVLKKYSDVNNFLEFCKENNFNVYQADTSSVNSILKLKENIKYFKKLEYCCIMLLFIIVYSCLSSMFNDEKENISILKVVGYPNKNIIYILFLRTAILIILSVVLLCFIMLLFYLIVYILNISHIISFINYIKIYNILFIVIKFCLVVLILNMLIYLYKLKIKPIEFWN